jgi:hypothetical protein
MLDQLRHDRSQTAQLGEFLDISVNDDFGASAAIVVPTPAVPYLEAYVALLHPVPGVGLTVVGVSGGVDLDLSNKRFNSSH